MSLEEVSLLECPICGKLHDTMELVEACYVECGTIEKSKQFKSSVKAKFKQFSNELKELKPASVVTASGAAPASVLKNKLSAFELYLNSKGLVGLSFEEREKTASLRTPTDSLTPLEHVESNKAKYFELKYRISMKVAPTGCFILGEPCRVVQLESGNIKCVLSVALEDSFRTHDFKVEVLIMDMLKACLGVDFQVESAIVDGQSSEFVFKLGWKQDAPDWAVLDAQLHNMRESLDKLWSLKSETAKLIEHDVDEYLSSSGVQATITDIDEELVALREKMAVLRQKRVKLLVDAGEQALKAQQKHTKDFDVRCTEVATVLSSHHIRAKMPAGPELGYGELKKYLELQQALLTTSLK